MNDNNLIKNQIRIRKIRKIRKIRTAMISTLIIVLMIFIGTMLYTKFFSVGKHTNKVKAVSLDKKTKLVNKVKKEETDKGIEVDKNINVAESGKKYAYDALEIQNVLVKGITKVDGHKIAFLTFDDGPSTTVTPKILKILNENNVHATFSVIGKEVEENNETKALVRQEIEQGNAIGNHTYSHNYRLLYPNGIVNVSNFMNEVDKTNEILKSILGSSFHTRIIRMPGGHMSWKGTKPFDDELNKRGYVYIDWNDDDEDSVGQFKNSEQIFEEVKKYDCGQDRLVIIMHDTYGKEATAGALPEIIQYLKGQGYEFRTLA